MARPQPIRQQQPNHQPDAGDILLPPGTRYTANSEPNDGSGQPAIQWHTIPRDASIPCPSCGAGALRVMKTWDDEDCYPERERVTVCQRRYCPSCDAGNTRPIYTRYYRPRTQTVAIMPR